MTTKWFGDKIADKVNKAVMRAVVRGTESVHTEAVRLMQTGKKSGRTYRRNGTSHTASAPGQPPAVDTGYHIQNSGTVFAPAELKGTVLFTAEYAAHLEFGTKKMIERPYARPALQNKVDGIMDNILKEVRRATS